VSDKVGIYKLWDAEETAKRGQGTDNRSLTVVEKEKRCELIGHSVAFRLPQNCYDRDLGISLSFP